MNSIHDIGGMDGFGPVVAEENEPAFHEAWEGRVRAMSALVNQRVYSVHVSRHTMERMDPVFYLSSSYYQKWLLALEIALKERGIFTEEEIQEKMSQISPESPFASELHNYRKVAPEIVATRRKPVIQVTTGTEKEDEPVQPRFSPGDLVKVKLISPLGHSRVPRYVRGKQGVIVKLHGKSILPEVHVYEGRDLYQPVYLVCFEAREIWGEDASPNEKIYIEFWEDYLEVGVRENEKA